MNTELKQQLLEIIRKNGTIQRRGMSAHIWIARDATQNLEIWDSRTGAYSVILNGSQVADAKWRSTDKRPTVAQQDVLDIVRACVTHQKSY